MQMHSTTATSSFTLQKYSRSYPNTNGTEWQHYTNPTIQLTVDAKNASNGELESVRLRIVWTMDNGEGMNMNQIVFEDLDLLSFASLPLRKPQKQPQGLPLKAVYRDTVVGIRYLHPREFTTAPTYRRFQMTFTSPAAASQFINAIQSVCPCKLNGTAADPKPAPIQPFNTTYTQQHPSAPHTAQRQQQMLHSMPTKHSESQFPMTMESQYPQPIPSRMSMMPSHWGMDQSTMHTQTIRTSSPALNLSDQAPPSQDLGAGARPMFSSSPAPSNQLDVSFRAPDMSSGLPVAAPIIATQPQSTPSFLTPSLPSSSAPRPVSTPVQSQPSMQASQISSSSAPAPPTLPPPPPSKVPLDSLTKTQLYTLSPTELQAYAEEIIQEEGFSKLLQALSTSWTLKNRTGIEQLG